MLRGSAPTTGGKGRPCLTPAPSSLSSGFHEHRSRCNPNPCFSGVDCMETYEYPGYRCGPCPPGLEGNGTHCADIDEVGALQMVLPLTGKGSTGNSSAECRAGGEGVFLPLQCAHANPCFPGSKCINTAPGFRCEPCPRGYRGNTVSGVGADYARASKQVSAVLSPIPADAPSCGAVGTGGGCCRRRDRNGQSCRKRLRVMASPTLLAGLHGY